MTTVFYLPESSRDLEPATLRESMRRHHWKRYFLCLRARNAPQAAYHRALAEELEHRTRQSPSTPGRAGS